MFSKNPSKETLRQMLQSQYDHAMLLDNSIKTVCVDSPIPVRTKYRPRKPKVDAYQQEIALLKNGKVDGAKDKCPSAQHPIEAAAELDVASLETEVAAFIRNRRRK